MPNPHPPDATLSPEQPLLEALTPVGRFRIEGHLGHGGMGEVYRAWDPLLERSVALKRLRNGAARDSGGPERFRREALALAQLNHPNVCQVHDLVDDPLGTFIAMELVEGSTLDQAGPVLTPREKLQVLQCVAQALEATHAKGIVHRDLKPRNVMVHERQPGEPPRVKVVDFGLMRLLTPSTQEGLPLTQAPGRSVLTEHPEDFEETSQLRVISGSSDHSGSPRGAGSGSDSSSQLTQNGTFMGSPGYASPEQIQGQSVGPASDVFSLGILAWELLTGEHPFPGDGRSRMKAIVHGTRRRFKAKGLPAGTEDLLKGMLETHPFKRPTAAKVAESFQHLLRPRRALWWTAALLVVAVLAVGAGSILPGILNRTPRRLAILPFINATGDSRFTGLIQRALPEDVGARLAGSAHLQVVEQETLARAAKKLGLDLSQPLDPAARKRLATYLKVGLLLRGDVRQSAGLTLDYVLEEPTGQVRAQGLLSPSGPPTVALQALPGALVEGVGSKAGATDLQAPTPEPGLSGEALVAYGQALELMGKGGYKEALPLMRTAAFQNPQAAGPVVGYASCLFRTGDPATDVALRWAVNTARLAKDRYREVIALKALALREREQRHLDLAVAAGREGVALAEKAGFEAQRVAILNNLGLVLQDQGKPVEAEACYRQAAEVQRRLPDPQGLANSINNLAILARNRGAFPEAEAQYREALALHQSQENRYGEALARTNLGDLTLSAGRFQEALEHLTKADALYQQVGNRTERATCQLNLGVLHQCQGAFDAAETAFQTSRSLAEEAQAPPTVALAWFYLAGLARQRGHIDEATARYHAARQRFGPLEASDSEYGDCLAGLAECALQRRSPSPAEAARLLKEATAKTKASDPFLLRARWRQALSAGQAAAATKLLGEALEAARRDQPEVCRELEALRTPTAR